MKKIILTFCLAAFFALSGFSYPKEITDYLGVAAVNFNGVEYKLSWSSHPRNNYYKQEYLPEGQTSAHFNDLLILNFMEGGESLKHAVNAQLNMLTERQKTDAACHFQVLEDKVKGEYILEFLMSEEKAGKATVVEWSAYHYKLYTDSLGHKGVLLFGASHRVYGGGTEAFFKQMSGYRRDMMRAFNGFPVPGVEVK